MKNIVCPWVTPKVFPDLNKPAERVVSFFDHYAEWFNNVDEVVLNFCTGNGDHILNYAGREFWDSRFDWSRFSAYFGSAESGHQHNQQWVQKVMEAGETKGNPYLSGPSFLLSEQVMTYHVLKGIYDAFRAEASRRNLNFKILEYLEPGPEFCLSEWKTIRHPEGAQGNADGKTGQNVIDVCSTLNADERPYVAFPKGIPAGTNTGTFVSAQTAAFVRDFGIDGVFLGNQFALIGFWHPSNAPEPTPQRRAGIRDFFHGLRREMGDKLVYWMDTYWPVEAEVESWAMSEDNYAQLDAVMCSNFAVIVDPKQIVPNLESRLRVSGKYGGKPATLFSLDFVDPWYAYRVHRDIPHIFELQHALYREHGPRCQGTSFFANDTFGQWVSPAPMNQTLQVLRQTHNWK